MAFTHCTNGGETGIHARGIEIDCGVERDAAGRGSAKDEGRSRDAGRERRLKREMSRRGSNLAGRVRSHVERSLRRALAQEGAEPAYPLLPVVAALVVGWVAMTWPWLSGRVTIPWDAKAHFLPQIQFLAQSLARGESPFWAPFVFSGHPQIADPQSMIFSPPFLLLALVNGNPSAWAVDIATLLAGLVGAIALAAWVRDQGWEAAGALLAGLVFVFGASMAWRLQHTIQVLSLAYWPIAMFAIDRAFARRSYRWGLAAGIVGAFILLDRDQVALLVAYLLVAQVLWRWLSSDNRAETFRDMVGPLLTGGIVCVAIVIVPVLLTALFAAESNRPAIDFEGAGRGSLHPALFLTLLMPQLFGAAYRMEDYWGPPSFTWSNTGLFVAQNMGEMYLGAIPVLLLLLGAAQNQFLAREVRFFTVAFIVAVLYALGWFTPLFRLFYEVLPGVKYYRRPADATFLIGGLGAVLTGYAAHRLFSRPWDRINEHAVVLIGAVLTLSIAIAFGIAMWLDHVGEALRPLGIAVACLVVATAALAFVKSRIGLQPWPMALVLAAVTVADLAYNNGPSTSSAWSPAAYDAMQPDTRNATVRYLRSRIAESDAADPSGARRDRIELLGVGFHWPNVSLSQRLENTLGYNPLRLDLYSRATGAEDHVGMMDQRKMSPLLPSYKSLLVDMLGLRFIAAGQPLEWFDKQLKPGDLKLVAKTEHNSLDPGRIDSAWIYENPRALPRVLFPTRSMQADFDALLKTGAWPAFDPRATVLLEREAMPDVVRARAGNGASAARLVRYRNTDIEIEAESSDGGWLVLNDPWHPWWYATVDGAAAPIVRANVLFRAVALPPGRHTVRFRFRPITALWQRLSGAAFPR